MRFQNLSQGLLLGLLASAPLATAYGTDADAGSEVERRYVGSLSSKAAQIAREVIPEIEKRHHVGKGGKPKSGGKQTGKGVQQKNNQKRHHTAGDTPTPADQAAEPADPATSQTPPAGNAAGQQERKGKGKGRGKGKGKGGQPNQRRHHSAGPPSGASGSNAGDARKHGGHRQKPKQRDAAPFPEEDVYDNIESAERTVEAREDVDEANVIARSLDNLQDDFFDDNDDATLSKRNPEDPLENFFDNDD